MYTSTNAPYASPSFQYAMFVATEVIFLSGQEPVKREEDQLWLGR